MSQGLGQAISQLGLGLLNFGPAGLIVGDIVGRSNGVFALSRMLSKDPALNVRAVWRGRIREVATRYKKFPMFSSSSGLLRGVGSLAPLFIAQNYGPDVAGWVALSNLVVSGPLSLLSSAVGDVYFNESARIGKVDTRRQARLLWKLVARMALISAPFIGIMLLSAHWVFPVIFGPKWTQSALYLTQLAPMYFVMCIASPTHPILTVFEKQELHLLREITRAPLMLGPLVVAGWLALDPQSGLACYSLGTCVFYALSMIPVWHVVRKSRQRS